MGSTQVENATEAVKPAAEEISVQVEDTMQRVATEDLDVRLHWKTYFALVASIFGMFCQITSVAGSGVLATPIATLFNASTDSVWPGSILNIVSVAILPSISRIVDLWGRRTVLLICTIFGFIGAIIISRASSIGMVLAGFAIMSVSCGVQSPLYAIPSEIVPRKYRPWAQAALHISASTGGGIGIVMSGALLRHGHYENYRYYYYYTAALEFLSFVGFYIGYHPPLRELQSTLTTREKLRRLDWIGSGTFIPGLVLVSIALSWSKNPYEWTNAHILAPFITGITMIIIFGLYEWRFTKEGILPHSLFVGRLFPLACICTFVEGVAFWASNFYYAEEMSLYTGSNFLDAAGAYSLVLFISLVGTLITGWVAVRTRSTRYAIIIGFTCFVVYYALLATRTPNSPKKAWWAYPVLAGLGLGILLPAIMIVAQLSTPPELIAMASGLLVACRALGGVVSMAINNSMFNGALATYLPKKIAEAALPLGLPQSSLGPLINDLSTRNQTALAQIPGITAQIIGAAAAGMLDAFNIGFTRAWWASLAFSIFGLLACVFILDPRDQYTAHIDAPAEAELVEAQARLEARLGNSEKYDV